VDPQKQNFCHRNCCVSVCQASYGVEDAEYAITQLAQTTMRSEIGKITLDTVFRERELLNIAIVGEMLTCATVIDCYFCICHLVHWVPKLDMHAPFGPGSVHSPYPFTSPPSTPSFSIFYFSVFPFFTPSICLLFRPFPFILPE